jgi:hypothetical protein
MSQQPPWQPQQPPNNQPQWGQQYEQTQQSQYGFPPTPYNAPSQQPNQWSPPQQFPQSQWVPQQPPIYSQPPMVQQANVYIQQPRQRPKRLRWIIVGIIATVVLFVCIGSALATHSNNTGTVTQTTQSSGAGNTPIPAQNQHFKVGQVVKVGDSWDMTVNSLKTNQGQGFDTPKNGTVYLLIDVTLKNISTSEQAVSSLAMFSLRDIIGQEYTETITTFTHPLDGKVEAGAPIRGTFAYEVPPSQRQFTFAFTPDLVGGGQSI